MPRVVSFHGLPGVGKDYLAEAMVARGWVRVAFADPIRSALYALDPLVDGKRLSAIVDCIGWDRAKREYQEIRRLLQRFGTEVGRDLWGDNFWLLRARDIVDKALADGKNVVIPDVRMLNEAFAIRGPWGGEIWEIVRDGVVASEDHRSNVRLPDRIIDATLVNSGEDFISIAFRKLDIDE